MDSIENTNSPSPAISQKYLITIISIIVLGVIAVLSYFAFFKNDKPINPISQKKKLVISTSIPFVLDYALFTLDGAKMAFDEEKYDPNFEFEFKIMDNSGESTFDEKKLRDQLKEITRDDSVIAFWGPVQSTAAKVSIPVLNQAGIPMISPTNSWPGLTKTGFGVDEPARFYPTGVRNYTRLSPTDELETTNAANWGKEMGFKSVSLIGDGTLDPSISIIFTKQASNIGIDIKDRLFIDKDNISETVKTIVKNAPDFLYYYGVNDVVFVNFVVNLKKAGYKGKIMSGDSAYGKSFEAEFKDYVEGVLLTSVNIDLKELKNPLAESFIGKFKQTYRKDPTIYAGMGYESMKILMKAIKNSDGTRKDVLRELFNTRRYPSMFGPVTFDANGDNSGGVTTKNIVKDGKIKYLGIIGSESTIM